jgi:hypothetical protein
MSTYSKWCVIYLRFCSVRPVDWAGARLIGVAVFRISLCSFRPPELPSTWGVPLFACDVASVAMLATSLLASATTVLLVFRSNLFIEINGDAARTTQAAFESATSKTCSTRYARAVSVFSAYAKYSVECFQVRMFVYTRAASGTRLVFNLYSLCSICSPYLASITISSSRTVILKGCPVACSKTSQHVSPIPTIA